MNCKGQAKKGQAERAREEPAENISILCYSIDHQLEKLTETHILLLA